jgi:RHS repeat-associated protein
MNSGCANPYQNFDYEFDGMGNLIKQQNLITGFEEKYVYDNLMRVQAAQVKMGALVVANYDYDYDYDAVGNITNKSDHGSNFIYNTSRSEGGNAGPNAVRRITRNGSNYHFTYDDNGNMLTGNGLTQTIYNKDNKATKIVKNGTTTNFSYGADGMRFKQVKTSGGKSWTTYYVGKGFEREIQPNNRILDKTFVGDHTTLYKAISGTPDYPAKVVHTLNDRLGSPSTLITGSTSSPTIIRYRAHGVFGRPIDAGNGSSLSNLLDWDSQNRGYTGHEHLVEQQLIHMNGRIYDYNLGRFMSVDPFIQMPESSQSINPYSYIMNNPMSGTDPSGYLSDFAAGAFCSGSRIGSCGSGGVSANQAYVMNASEKHTKIASNKVNANLKSGDSGNKSKSSASPTANMDTANIGKTGDKNNAEKQSSSSTSGDRFSIDVTKTYSLTGSIQEQANSLAEITGLSSELVENATQNDLDAISGAVLYRHLDKNQRGEALSIIRSVENKKLEGKLVSSLLDTAFVNPQWGAWSLTNSELIADQAFHQTVEDYASVIGLSASGASAYEQYKRIRNTGKLGRNGVAIVTVWGAILFNKSELNKANQEIKNRSTLNESSFHDGN